MTLRTAIGKLHLWLGLSSGLVVFIISITGCIYAFQVEIQDLIQGFRYVEAEQKPFVPPSEMRAIGERELPGKKIHSVLYKKPGEAAVVSFYNADPAYYYLIYVNPYSGEVLKLKDMDKDFFRIVLMGHFYLWLPPQIGQSVVASSTLVFLVMLVSGLFLWWPRNKAATKQRFSIKWNVRWRRKNYDLHNVLGFYMTWIVIFIALTGLVWGFRWFAKGTYYTLSGGRELLEYQEPLSDTTSFHLRVNRPAVDKVWEKMKPESKIAETIEVHYPETAASPILASINPDKDTYWKIDYRFFDQYSLKELPVNHLWGRFKEATAADKVLRMNYDIHVGGILGLPGKLLALFVSLIAASLPVTGFFIWWGRRSKGNKNPVGRVPSVKSSARVSRGIKELVE